MGRSFLNPSELPCFLNWAVRITYWYHLDQLLIFKEIRREENDSIIQGYRETDNV